MSASVYRPRRPQNSPYYQCVEDHFEAFEGIYEDRFEQRYGFFRPYIKEVIYRYLDCGMLTVSPVIDCRILGRLFRHYMLKMLLEKGKITKDMIALLDQWRHTGFNVYCGQRILPWKKTSMENLARYIIRASFSQERMTYVPEAGSVIYQSKDSRATRVFDALEWLVAMTSHVPNKGEQMVR